VISFCKYLTIQTRILKWKAIIIFQCCKKGTKESSRYRLLLISTLFKFVIFPFAQMRHLMRRQKKRKKQRQKIQKMKKLDMYAHSYP
jgi:hypothetical protein